MQEQIIIFVLHLGTNPTLRALNNTASARQMFCYRCPQGHFWALAEAATETICFEEVHDC